MIFWLASYFICYDQVSSIVANDFTERALDFASPFCDLLFFRKESIKVFVKLTDLCSEGATVISFVIKLFAKGSIFNSSAVFSFSASFTLVSTTTVLV